MKVLDLSANQEFWIERTSTKAACIGITQEEGNQAVLGIFIYELEQIRDSINEVLNMYRQDSKKKRNTK